MNIYSDRWEGIGSGGCGIIIFISEVKRRYVMIHEAL